MARPVGGAIMSRRGRRHAFRLDERCYHRADLGVVVATWWPEQVTLARRKAEVPLNRCASSFVGLMLAVAASSHAQTPTTISCADARGQAVRAVQTANGVLAKATTDEGGHPTIQYDARRVDEISPQLQLFVYSHECAHHALGHDTTRSFTDAQEHDADCRGIDMLTRRVGFTSNDVRLLQASMLELGPGTARRFPWRARMYDLEGCLPEVISRREASRPKEMTATDCVVHNDAENAIVSASRDRLTIEGTYTVRNRCARDVSCTFTIELGTLPYSDIDTGSWRNFRAQTTITEQHMLPANQANVEFRFRGSADAIQDGSAVDFRVVPACR
jgi:hypothetical protein